MAYLWQAAVRTRAQAQAQAQFESLQRVRAEQLLTEARLAARHSQIEPHFLFITLATVRRCNAPGRPKAPSCWPTSSATCATRWQC